MARLLRTAGLTVIAAIACLALAESAGWVDGALVDPWIRPGFHLGVAALALGVLGAILGPLVRMVVRTRCVRCGIPIERGQVYCADHLKQTVAEYADQERERVR
jgi:hypothetical protein